MRFKILCSLLVLLLAACAGPSERQTASRIYAEQIKTVKGTFQGIPLYGPLPAGFVSIDRPDKEVGCLWHVRQEMGTFDMTRVCVDDRDQVLMIDIYKEFTDEYAMNKFLVKTKQVLDEKYGKRVNGHQTSEKYLWEFKNEQEWVDAYLRYRQDAKGRDRYSRIYKEPQRNEAHDKLQMIVLEKRFGINLLEKRGIELKDYVAIGYVSRLAELKRTFKTETKQEEFRKSLQGL